VDHVFRVRGVQRTRHLRDHVDGAMWRQRAALGEQGCQVGAFDQAHIQVEPSIDLAEVVDRHDVRFTELGGKSAFPAEPGLEFGVSGQLRPKPLQCHNPSVDRVEGAVHVSHAAPPEQLFQAIRTEQL
jgi:hypothetical protein